MALVRVITIMELKKLAVQNLYKFIDLTDSEGRDLEKS